MVQDISTGLSEKEYTLLDGVSRGQKLEELLCTICNTLGEVGSLTEEKADVEFLLSVVGSYLISKKQGKLSDDVLHPNELFDANLFPMLDNVTLEVEDITEEETDEG